MLIGDEKTTDWPAVHSLNVAAFPTAAEADLVDVLRLQAKPFISLVADEAEAIVGHILFTPVSLAGHPNLNLMGLAPMAVAPAQQRKGIGSALVKAGLERCKELSVGGVVVLGHPEFYPRFGFLPSSRFALVSEYDVPEEVFMALELRTGYFNGAAGTIKYHAAFGEL